MSAALRRASRYRNVRLAVALSCAAIVLLAASDEPDALQAARSAPRVHALLIGVTKYPTLKERFQLEGPINDVALIRSVLQKRFKDASIVELSEARGADGIPTRVNIEREFTRLAGPAVNAGDRVVIFYAGHGSQQPDTDPRGTDEDDGLDEIILPRDVGTWDGTIGRVRNAIVDDEIRQWLTAIRNRGAFVFAVFDACQSSTLTRGEVETSRQVPMTELIPADVLARVTGRTRGGETAKPDILGLKNDAGGIAALYAAQTTEPTPERRLPNDNAPVHGLFTYTLAEILEQSASPITYRELVERAIEKYRAMGRIGPTPGFEGGGLDQPVLTLASAPAGPRWRLGSLEHGKLTLEAGAIQGLTTGTILRVFPPDGSAKPGELVGHVRVTSVDPLRAIVEPVAFGKTPAPSPARLIADSRAEIAVFDYGDRVVRVALHPDAVHGTTAAALNNALARIGSLTHGQAARASSSTAADWVLNANGDDITLAPASGWRIDPARSQTASGNSSVFRVGKVTAPNFDDLLTQSLNQVIRVRGLMQLATAPPIGGSDVDVALNLIRFRNPQDTTGTPVPLAAGGRILHSGDRIAFRVKNVGKTAVDVTLLFIDSQYGISPIFPRRDAESDSRLPRDREVVTPQFTVNADTLGAEQVIAIAVETAPVRTDFRYLAQPSLEMTRGASDDPPRSPLQQLLDRAVFGQGATRGLADTALRTYSIRMLSWRTERF